MGTTFDTQLTNAHRSSKLVLNDLTKTYCSFRSKFTNSRKLNLNKMLLRFQKLESDPGLVSNILRLQDTAPKDCSKCYQELQAKKSTFLLNLGFKPADNLKTVCGLCYSVFCRRCCGHPIERNGKALHPQLFSCSSCNDAVRFIFAQENKDSQEGGYWLNSWYQKLERSLNLLEAEVSRHENLVETLVQHSRNAGFDISRYERSKRLCINTLEKIQNLIVHLDEMMREFSHEKCMNRVENRIRTNILYWCSRHISVFLSRIKQIVSAPVPDTKPETERGKPYVHIIKEQIENIQKQINTAKEERRFEDAILMAKAMEELENECQLSEATEP